ncbi:MAG: GNAT family N-acetyltransferase [Butyrivibrio sp.]|nr:GNAT family N-acetyltransferase [Butyrivibrio sp.]
MAEIYSMTQGHNFWNETLSLAEKCSWRAGPKLAEKMKNNDFNQWERVFAARVDGKAAGFCTLAKRDELPSRYEYTPFIGFIFVDEQYRGQRLSEKMIKSAASYANALGYEKVYILSGEIGLYEKYGFTKLGDYETTYGSIDRLFVKSTLV